METEDILALYDRWERKEASLPGYRREEAEAYVRMIDERGEFNYISYSELDATNVDAAILDAQRYFARLDQAFEWKWYSHDRPSDLRERLKGHGFDIGEEEAIMALDLSEAPEWPAGNPAIELARIEDPLRVSEVTAIHEAVWGEDASPYTNALAERLRNRPDSLGLFVAYLDGKPVSASRMEFPSHSPFASLWGGATLKEYRGLGLYTAMLARRATEAKLRGYRFLTIDAGPMSRPIVEKRGFRLLALSAACTFAPDTGRRP